MTTSKGYILSGEGWELTIWPNGTGGSFKVDKSMDYVPMPEGQTEVRELTFTHEELSDIAEFLVYVQEQRRGGTA